MKTFKIIKKIKEERKEYYHFLLSGKFKKAIYKKYAFILKIKSKLKYKIYIEILNSFENYLIKFGILNVFNIENIVIGKSKENEKIKSLKYEIKEIKFNKLNEFENDKKIEKFIKDNFNTISIKQYFYHQIYTFIKLYINQFNIVKSKIIFKCKKYTKYFDK